MRIVLADHHPLMLAAVRQALAPTEGFEVVGEARSGQEVLGLVDRLAPDLVLLDLEMPGMSGLLCLDRIVTGHPQTKVVVWSEGSDPEQIEVAFKHGAHGYLVKSIAVVDLASAIRQAVQRTAYHALGLPAMRAETAAAAVGLTDRELTIVRAVARGMSNRAIGKQLFVTEQTIKFHMTNVLRKLGLENRTEVARWAHARGLFTEESHVLQRPDG